MKAVTAICGAPWAITPAALWQILEIAARETMDVSAVEAQLGRPLDNSHTVTVRDGVATIPVEGPIFRHADLMTQVSGATSVETLATDLRTALDDPAIGAILLAIDSPGGAVNGVGEFADMVYQARAVKPITAYISHQGASAAYWIAAAAQKVVCAPTALVGSIGVIVAVPDPAKSGSRSVEFVSSQSPKKVPDPNTDRGRTQVQATADDLADQFIAAVATYRGVSRETVLADFGAGDVLVGQKAVAAGLVDAVGTYEGTLAALQGEIAGPSWPRLRPAGAAAARQALAAQRKQGMAERHQESAQRKQGGARGTTGSTGPATTGAPAGGRKAMGFSWKFWEKTDAVERAELRASGVDVPEESTFDEVEARVQARLTEERARDRAAMREERVKRLQTEAAAKADGLIRGGQLTPAEREAYIAHRAAAALEDAERPPTEGQEGRVASFDAIYAARPSHGLFKEYVDPGTGAAVQGRVLTNPTGAGDPNDITTPAGAYAQAKAWAERNEKAAGGAARSNGARH